MSIHARFGAASSASSAGPEKSPKPKRAVRFALNLSSAAIIAKDLEVVRRIVALLRQTSVVFGNVAELEALMTGLDNLHDADGAAAAAAAAAAAPAGGNGGNGGGGGGGGHVDENEATSPGKRRLRFTVERAVKSLLSLMGGKNPRRAVITDGASPVVVATHDPSTACIAAVNAITLDGYQIPSAKQLRDAGEAAFAAAQPAVERFSVPPGHIDIVDSNGAGDSFVGGYLAADICEHPVDRCVHAGMFAAAECLQNQGCTFRVDAPDSDSFNSYLLRQSVIGPIIGPQAGHPIV